MKRKEASEPIFGTRVLFLLGGNEQDSTAAAAEWIFAETGEVIDNDTSEARARTFQSKGRFVVWIKEPSDMRALVHEITHAGVHAMAYIGHAVTEQSDEPLAYYCDWLMGEAMK